MSRDGSNVYTLPEAPFTAGTTAVAATMNSNLSDIATALNDSLCRSTETTTATRTLLLESSVSDVAQALGVWHRTASSTVSSPTANVVFVVPADAVKVRLEYWNFRPSTNNQELCFLVSTNGGSSYITTTSYYPSGAQYTSATAAFSGAFGSPRGNFAISLPALSAANNFAHGRVDIEVSGGYGVQMSGGSNDTGVAYRVLWGGGTYTPGARPTHIGVLPASGNIAQGEFHFFVLR